ncbi:MAG TPA: hypothetical protein VGI44_08900, partial [Acidimicrobiales bacterium]
LIASGVRLPGSSHRRRTHVAPGQPQKDNRTVTNTSFTALPATSSAQTDVAEQTVLDALAGTLDVGTDCPLSTTNTLPTQEVLPDWPPLPR